MQEMPECTGKWIAGRSNKILKKSTFSPADIFDLPSASLADSAPIPVDGRTADKMVHP